MLQTISEAIKNLDGGKILLLVDDEKEDSTGTLLISAQRATHEDISFMMKNGGGLLTLVLSEKRVDELEFSHTRQVAMKKGLRYITSVDYMDTENGIEPKERLQTVKQLMVKDQKKNRFRVPGHVYIGEALSGGVLKSAGIFEAASDLMQSAGLADSAIVCDLVNEKGELLRLKDVFEFGDKNGLEVVSIESLIAYRRETDCYVVREAEANLPTDYGNFRMVGFVNTLNGEHHVALVKGHIQDGDEVLVRVHSECLTGDAFHSLKCDCGQQLGAALAAIEKEGKGILLYLRQEGRGIGLINKIKAYKLQEEGLDTEEANLALGFPSDLRDYGIGAQILSELNAKKLRLMTNNPKKLVGLKGHGIEVVERVPLIMDTNLHNERYFHTKKEKMGHMY